MIRSKLFFGSRKTDRIHKVIERHIEVCPLIKVINLRRQDFELLRGTAIYPYMLKKDVLDYVDGYQVKAES